MADTHALPVEIGDLVAQKYRVEAVIGRGGMGIVVAARHVELNRRVAIKFLHPAAKSADAIERFMREGRASVMLESDHTVDVFDLGRLDSGEPFLVMEYLRGKDLGTVIEERGALPLDEAMDYVLQACEALAEAHSVGLVHRDIKPANLFLTTSPTQAPMIKVLDFGIAKAIAPTGDLRTLTNTKDVMGSPHYMSPEQLSAKEIDGRTDIWSLGASLYELLAGRPAFVGETLPLLCIEVMTGEPAPLRDRAPDVPEEVVRVIARCLEKDRAKRYADVGELARALEPYVPGSRGQADAIAGILRQARHPSGRPEAPSTTTSAFAKTEEAPSTPALAQPVEPQTRTAHSIAVPPPSTARRSPRSKVALALGAALVVVAGVGVGIATVRRAGTRAAASASATASLEVKPEPIASAPPLMMPSSAMPSAVPSAVVSSGGAPSIAPRPSYVRRPHPTPTRSAPAPTASIKPLENTR